MTENLFDKAVVFSDIHFGRNGNNPVANQDNLDFIDWFVEEAKTWGARTCLFLGDHHDNRNALHLSTLDYSLRAMEKLNAAFEHVWWIPGNHDLLYRNKRDVSSVTFGKYLPNIHILNEPTVIGNTTFLPWLVGDEHKRVRNIKTRYVFSHLELSGWMMNARVPMPHHENGLTNDDFKNGPEYVFSGHFHFRQAKENIVYIGNPMPFNFADAWDEDRGMMFLEWGKEPYFKAWPGQPLFRHFKLSQLLNEPTRYLADKLSARVTLDIDISYEEAQVIKDEFMEGFGVRRMELVHQPRVQDDLAFADDDVVFQTVDQIVAEGLRDLNTGANKKIDPAKLIEIYTALPNL